MPGQRAQHGTAVAVRLFQQNGAAAGQGQAFRLPAPLQEGPVGVLSGGDEAYLLAFLRYGHCQPRVLHLGDAGGLVLPGKGEHGPAQALQRHEGKEIALVLVGVASREQFMDRPSVGQRLLGLAAVVARGDVVGAQLQRLAQEDVEFDFAVAQHVGIGRAACAVFA